MSKPFVLNRHNRLVFPSNFEGDLDFSVIDTELQLEDVVRRDFEAKAPKGADIAERAAQGAYRTKYQLLRDMALNLFWSNRFAITMYDKRPMRWRDVPKKRADIYIPVLHPWEDGAEKVATITRVYEELPAEWDEGVESRIGAILGDVFNNKRHHATSLEPIKPTIAEFIEKGTDLAYTLAEYDPDYPVYTFQEILDCNEDVPELEALQRMAMVLHNQSPWDRSRGRLANASEIGDDDFVILFVPRTREVQMFIERARGETPPRRRPRPPSDPVRRSPVPPVVIADAYDVRPRIEALAVEKGEYVCTNDDVIRNSAYSWSPMSAAEISSKTGIETRLYTARDLEIIGLSAARAALDRSGRSPDEIAAVIFCSCTNTRLIPSVATWISGQLGIYQTHASFDLVAACAGFPYGLAEGIRILEDVKRPVLIVFGEKFSDKIGSVRTSRMIFGDGAAAVVLAPGDDDAPADVEAIQTYASGPVEQVNSIIWPNPEFDNDITVWGPEVKALVKRYLEQMMGELGTLPGETGKIDLVVPHQANRTMVVDLGLEAGIPEEQMYFNIDRVGNASAASIPIAIQDAVLDGVIDRPMRVFTPGFGAGAVAGYSVVRIDPDVVVKESRYPYVDEGTEPSRAFSWKDAVDAF